MLSQQALGAELHAVNEKKVAELLAQAQAALLQAENLKQKSSDLLSESSCEFEAYTNMINKLQAHQAEHLSDHTTLFNYFLTKDAYEFIHSQNMKKRFDDLFNLLEQLAGEIAKHKNTILDQPLNVAFLNSVLLIEDLSKNNTRWDFKYWEFGNSIEALNDALKKAIKLVRNPADETTREDLAKATDKMMNVIAPRFMSETTRNLLILGGVLATLVGLALIPVAVMIVSSLIFIPVVLSLPFILSLGYGLFLASGMDNENYNYLTNNTKTPLKQISKPGFFNNYQQALATEEKQVIELTKIKATL